MTGGEADVGVDVDQDGGFQGEVVAASVDNSAEKAGCAVGSRGGSKVPPRVRWGV